MFLANFMGRTQVYSSQEIANREVALHIKHDECLMSCMQDFSKESNDNFIESFSRENFSRAIEIWNQFAAEFYYWYPHQIVRISECKLDSKFI